MAFIALCLSFTMSSNAEIITDDRFFEQSNTLEGLDQKKTKGNTIFDQKA